jgi:hypothetical protein
MQTLKNVTEGILPFQQALLDKVSQGFKAGQMIIYSGGRQTGKSTLNQYYGKLWSNNNLCKEIFLPMKPEPKYKFSRAKWYVVDYNWRDYDAVREWCTQQFGPHPKNPDAWSRWWHSYADTIRFRDEKDYQWFLLRWCV